MFPIEFEIVINTEFGGFSVDAEMALWLMENRNWIIIKDKDYDYKTKYPINHLVEMAGDYFYSPYYDKIEFRMNQDLIDCVRAIKEVHKNDEYPDSWYGHIHKLSIQKIEISLGVENYYDGKERVTTYTST